MARYSTLAALSAVLFIAQPCLGEPVTITGGSATLFADGGLGSFSFTGPDTLFAHDSRSTWGPTSYSAGTPVQFTGRLIPDGVFHGFSMTVNGVSYDDVVFGGTATFVTGPHTATAGDPGSGNVDVPLLLTGHFDAFAFGDVGGTPLFSFDLNLPGVFQAAFTNAGGDLFVSRSLAAVAQFGASTEPAATPEPASILLLGTPLAAMGLRRIRRGRDR